ncbi:MAG: hypothetical protein HY688_03045 [Chloroflexi bacterium]|nr:hypothetical protein [Chloroflexota bacterium]
MQQQEIWALIERLGGSRSGHFRDGDQHATVALGPLDPLVDPVATDRLARELAAALSEMNPDVILVWAGLPSLLLGFGVAIALQRPVVRLTADEGLVGASGPIKSGQRAVLVGEALTQQDIQLARAYVQWSGAALLRLATLVDEGEAGDVVALVSMEGRRFPADRCPLCRRREPLDDAVSGQATNSRHGSR